MDMEMVVTVVTVVTVVMVVTVVKVAVVVERRGVVAAEARAAPAATWLAWRRPRVHRAPPPSPSP